MRVFTVVDPVSHESGPARVTLPEGHTVWGVPESAAATNSDEREELEFDALTECVLTAAYAAQKSGEESTRLMCAAVDISASVVRPAGVDNGQWALTLTRESAVTIASYLVSELSAQGAIASDFAPEMLWFDASEASTARAYALEAN